MSNVLNKYAVITPGFLPVPALQGGAVEVLTQLIVDGLDRNKIDFDLYTVADQRYNFRTYENGTIIPVKPGKMDFIISKLVNIVLKVTRSNWRLRAYHIALLRLLGFKKYTSILVENNMELFWVIHSYTKNKNNLIFHLHNDIDDCSKSPKKCQYIIDNAKKILVVSEYLKQRVYEVKHNSVTQVLLNCIDINKFCKRAKQDTRVRNKYNVAETDIVVMYTGRIDPNKGVLELIKAFNQVCRVFSNITLVIVGASWFDEKEIDSYEKQVRDQTRNNNRIKTIGFVHPQSMPSILDMSDIVVIPSKWEEPFGVVALEAMCMQKCIISTNSGGLKYILDSKSAVLVNKDNLVQDLYAALIDLLPNPQKRDYLAANAYSTVMSIPAYDSRNYIKEYLDLSEWK